jgi:hypothetical protein
VKKKKEEGKKEEAEKARRKEEHEKHRKLQWQAKEEESSSIDEDDDDDDEEIHRYDWLDSMAEEGEWPGGHPSRSRDDHRSLWAFGLSEYFGSGNSGNGNQYPISA